MLGSVEQMLVVAWRDFGGNRQLRRRHRAIPPEAREIAAWDLVNVEAIPFDAVSKGITRGLQDYAPALVQLSAVALVGALVTIACRSYEAERLSASV
jgi:hypothetical protein